jgi:hypothetical protein
MKTTPFGKKGTKIFIFMPVSKVFVPYFIAKLLFTMDRV